MSTAKKEVELLPKRLPEDCSLEDIQHHLYVIQKVHRGLEVANTRGTYSQKEVEVRLSKWIIEQAGNPR